MTIKEARIRACMTQKQLSEMLGIPSRTIEDWEAGRRKPSDYVEKLVIQEINRISRGISPNIFDEIFLRFCGQRVTDQTAAQTAAQTTPFTQIGIFDNEGDI